MKEEEITVADNEFVAEIKHIINSARQNAVRAWISAVAFR